MINTLKAKLQSAKSKVTANKLCMWCTIIYLTNPATKVATNFSKKQKVLSQLLTVNIIHPNNMFVE